ncbi:MAG: galactokinase [Christensenellales bacterium]
MAKLQDLKARIQSGAADALFDKIYGEGAKEGQAARWCALLDSFAEKFGQAGDVYLFSTSGRTEIGGNHTDHNHGRVLAAGISLDTIAVVAPTDDGVITAYSEGYPGSFKVDTADTSLKEYEKGTTTALFRGMAARFKGTGMQVGGFNATIASNVLRGSGLSSSAAFEVLIATILDHLYNGGDMDGAKRAIYAQWVENNYFGKPCGLMDQMACSIAGMTAIDFADPANPVVDQVHFDFSKAGYKLVVVDTGGDHGDLTDAYASIPVEMKQVAMQFGKAVLRDVDEAEFYQALPRLKGKVPDRAILRAMHFFGDNARVAQQVQALNEGDFAAFLQMIKDSGNSSWTLLQNCFMPGNTQPITLGLAVSAHILADKGGAWRVHGGGFAGTIQAFVPDAMVETYVNTLNSIFGPKACTALNIRPVGSMRVDDQF